VRLSHNVTPRPCDELRLKPRLFGKFCRATTGRGSLRTLFIKLEFILNERRPRMVNDACAAAAASRERSIKPITRNLAVEIGQ
jgi:hypothetical protein